MMQTELQGDSSSSSKIARKIENTKKEASRMELFTSDRAITRGVPMRFKANKTDGARCHLAA